MQAETLESEAIATLSLRKGWPPYMFFTARDFLQLPRYSAKFHLTKKLLIKEWKHYGRGGTTNFHLSELSPVLGTTQGMPPTGKRCLRRGFLLLGAGTIIYYSQFHQMIPLLAPILFFLGIAFLLYGVPYFRIEKWTIVLRKDGNELTYIVHSGCDPLERKAFEDALTETVKKI